MKTYSGEKQNQCKQFDYISSGPSTLRTHLKRHSEVKSNKCNQCNFSSTWPTNLRTHLKMHSGEKLDRCNLFIICILWSRQLDKALENTQWRKIKTAASISFPLFMQTLDYIVEMSKQCKQCHYTCSDASALRRPLKTHNGEKTNKGNQCKFPETVLKIQKLNFAIS